MPVNTVVAQVPVPGSGQLKSPAGILVDERSSRLSKGRSRGNLYILLEIAGDEAGRNTIAGELVETIRQIYYERRGSITSGLQQAIHEAGRLLFEENRNALPGEQLAAGVSCVVLREEDLFIAQAGPSAIYVQSGGEISRFPEISPWLDGIHPEEFDAAPLGASRDISVSLFHIQVNEGDTLLLVESDPAGLVHDQAWPKILGNPSVGEVLNDLASQSGELAALVIRMGKEEQAPERTQAAITTNEESAVAPKSEALPAAVGQWLEQLHLQESLQKTAKMLVTVLTGVFAALVVFFKGLIPGQTVSQPTIKREPPARKIPQEPPPTRTSTRRTSPAVQKTLMWVAIAIPLIVAIIVILTYTQRDRLQKVEIDTMWQQASERWQQAQGSSDQAAARTLLHEADGYLTELLATQPDHPEAKALAQRVQAQQDEINQVTRITWISPLRSYPAESELTRVVVEGIHIFVLDRRTDQVYHHQLDDYQQALLPDSENTVLVKKGDQIADIMIGDLVDMTWMAVGPNRPKANLLILDSGGSLIEYDPATGERSILGIASESWQNPQLVGSYFGRFYLLDPTANQIWRYQPAAGGYSQPPEAWLQSEVDLAGVVDMAIGDSIYLLYADGKMKKLSAGQPDAFDISDWDQPPNSPSALFTRPPDDTQWVYVADRGNGRIVQASKEGRFGRQFRMGDLTATGGNDPLAGVTSLFVDEISGHAYFASDQQLFIAILPEQ